MLVKFSTRIIIYIYFNISESLPDVTVCYRVYLNTTLVKRVVVHAEFTDFTVTCWTVSSLALHSFRIL